MPCHNGNARRAETVCDRDAGVSWCGDGRTDAGDDFIGDTGRTQRFRLFAASAEDEGIAAFEPNDALTLARFLNEQRFDVPLLDAVFARSLADINHLSLGMGKFQQV